MGACGCKPATEAEEQQPSTSTSDTQVLLKPPTQTSRFRRTGTARVHPSLEISPVAVASFTHEGGAGGLGKENQDTRFTAQPDHGAVMVCGVFDGHGKRHGQLAARVAAEATEDFLRTHVAALVEDPEQTLRRAFAWSHAAIRKAMLASDASLRVVGGEEAAEEVSEAAYLLEWLEAEEEDEEAEWDAADGGTTATVAVLLHGRTLVVAAVGDSSALLLARDSAGQPVHAALCSDHGPTNVAEYDRMQSHPSQPCRFVYDCPDEAEEIAIFHQAEDGGTVLDSAALARADAADVALKNARGERCTVVWIPETSLELPHRPDLSDAQGAAQRVTLEEQATTVTRSLGDFYAHGFGVSCEPEVARLELESLAARGWRGVRLLLATDGVWDLWEHGALAERVTSGGEELSALGRSLCEETRARGAEYFQESADNLTGVIVDLDEVVRVGAVQSSLYEC